LACVLYLYLIISVLLFVRYILVYSSGPPFGKCHFCYIYLFVHGVLIYFVLCLLVEGYFYSCVLKVFNKTSYIFAALCKGDPLLCVQLRGSIYISSFGGTAVHSKTFLILIMRDDRTS
jgi:hypothetical protein